MSKVHHGGYNSIDDVPDIIYHGQRAKAGEVFRSWERANPGWACQWEVKGDTLALNTGRGSATFFYDFAD